VTVATEQAGERWLLNEPVEQATSESWTAQRAGWLHESSLERTWRGASKQEKCLVPRLTVWGLSGDVSASHTPSRCHSLPAMIAADHPPIRELAGTLESLGPQPKRT
jgi:hypothetical protein